jgi:hypothetical protein
MQIFFNFLIYTLIWWDFCSTKRLLMPIMGTRYTSCENYQKISIFQQTQNIPPTAFGTNMSFSHILNDHIARNLIKRVEITFFVTLNSFFALAFLYITCTLQHHNNSNKINKKKSQSLCK